MDPLIVLEATKHWVSTVVIGLNLCPFARRVFEKGLIRFVVSDARDEEELTTQLGDELQLLARSCAEEIETTLLILPHLFDNFLEFNEYLGLANRLLAALGFEGILQIASFHPRYQFQGTDSEDLGNFTNRSPCPMLHLLREESISRVALDPKELLEIPQRNIELLKTLGREKVEALLRNSTPIKNP